MVYKHQALIVLAIACADSPVEIKSERDARWQLAGRETPLPSTLPQPPPFSAGREALEGCDELPCAAELWKKGEDREIGLRIGSKYHFGKKTWPSRWERITGALHDCLGDPLAHPLAGNGANTRELVQTPAPYWILTLAAQNPCKIEGVLRIEADGKKVWTEGLEVEGKKWKEGGSEMAHHFFLLYLSARQSE
jgi:hypothetical protein